MDPDVRKTLMELNRPRGKFRTQVLKKSQEKVSKNIKTFKYTRVLNKIRENIPKCTCTRELSRAFCTELFPFWGIMKKYSIRKYLLADFVAGLTVGIIHIPQGMAYGLLTNLPPVYGLYTSFFPVILYFFFGSSKKVSLGTYAVTSLMVGAVVQEKADIYLKAINPTTAPIPPSTIVPVLNNTKGTPYNIVTANTTALPLVTTTRHHPTAADLTDDELRVRVGLAMSVSFMAGMIQLFLGSFRFGGLASFMSDPLISGFTTGAAIHVFTSQVKYLFGVQVFSYHGAFKMIYFYRDFFGVLDKVNPVAAVGSVTTIFVLILIKEGINNNPTCKKSLPVPIPIELFVVIGGTVISHYTKINEKFDVEVVGYIPVGVPAPTLSHLSFIGDVIGDAIAVSFVAFATSYAMAKILAEKDKEEVNANQELVANGLCNVIGALFSAFCCSASLSRSLVQDNSGGKTQVVGLVSSLLVFIVIAYIGPMFSSLPNCILACIVIVTLKGMFHQFHDMLFLWRLCKRDFAVWMVTFLATVILDAGLGLMVGVIFALYFVLRNTQRPYICAMGRVPGTNAYKDLKLSRTLIQIPGIKIFRFDCNLYFANAEQFRDRLYERTGLNPRKLKRKKQRALYKAMLKRKREIELAEIEEAAAIKKEKKQLLRQKSSIEEDVERDDDDDRELTDEQQTELQLENGEMQTRFSRAWVPPVHTVVLDFSVISYVDSVAVKVLSQIIMDFKEVGIKVFLAGCREDVRKIIKKSEFYKSIDYNCLYFTIHEAVVIAQELHQQVGDPPLSPKDILIVEEESREASARLAAYEGDDEKVHKDIPQVGANE
ncbi:prestin-like [Saccostrea echinata]|uniref:prestin-like n=1 Tax=Saccostrea echinata TaxID=191078 RepID=UPI002A80FD5F|nr:prestin-like [Saccostrea echinata]